MPREQRDQLGLPVRAGLGQDRFQMLAGSRDRQAHDFGGGRRRQPGHEVQGQFRLPAGQAEMRPQVVAALRALNF